MFLPEIAQTVLQGKTELPQELEIDKSFMRIHHECEGGIEKSVPRITVWHQKACRVMTNSDREGWIFLSHPHTNYGLFSCSPLIPAFYIGKKTRKWFPENPEFAEMRHGDVNYNDATDLRATDVRLFVFCLSHGLVWVCEINRIHHWCSVGTGESQLEGPSFQW